MSNYEQITTDEHQNLEKVPRKNLKRSKSKNHKSKTKKKPEPSQDSSNNRPHHDVEIDQPFIRPKDIIEESKGNSTLTKRSGLTDHKPQIERQVKLNYFISKKSASDSTSMGSTVKYAVSEFERKKKSLEKELSEKDALIERLKNEKEANLNKYAKLKLDAEEHKAQAKRILEKELRVSSKARRDQKAEIYPKLGYYKQAGWTTFIEGEYIIQAKKRVESLETRIIELQTRKKNSREEQRDRVSFQIEYLTKEKIQALNNLRQTEAEVCVYKEKLRLADKEANCTMAKADWPLINCRYLPLELLGSGGFGEVYKCYDLEKTNYVAIKTNCFQPTKNIQNRQKFIEHVQREVNTLKCLNHPNIAKLVDEITIDNKISFVLEYCSGPQLSKYLSKREFLEEKQARSIIKQISFALKYMYDQKYRIIHYDLKPANIIFHYGCVKILDFGLCKKMDSEDTKIDLTSQGVGTYWYLPPETFKEYAEISSKVDVWSLGVIFYELMFGKRPFGHGVNQTKIYQEGIILKAMKVEFPSDKKFKVSDEAKDFIRACLKYKASERLDPEEVYNHYYLNKFKIE